MDGALAVSSFSPLSAEPRGPFKDPLELHIIWHYMVLFD